MDIYMLSEENHGFIGAFSSFEKALEGAKKWLPIEREYEVYHEEQNYWEIDFKEEYCLMTVDKITLDKIEY